MTISTFDVYVTRKFKVLGFIPAQRVEKQTFVSTSTINPDHNANSFAGKTAHQPDVKRVKVVNRNTKSIHMEIDKVKAGETHFFKVD